MRASSMEDSVRDAARVFARQIGSLSADPAVRDHLLKTAVREMSWRLFNEFGDHYRLAQQLQTMAELAWLGAAALRAAEIGSTSKASHMSMSRAMHPSEFVAWDEQMPASSAPDDSPRNW